MVTFSQDDITAKEANDKLDLLLPTVVAKSFRTSGIRGFSDISCLWVTVLLLYILQGRQYSEHFEIVAQISEHERSKDSENNFHVG